MKMLSVIGFAIAAMCCLWGVGCDTTPHTPPSTATPQVRITSTPVVTTKTDAVPTAVAKCRVAVVLNSSALGKAALKGYISTKLIVNEVEIGMNRRATLVEELRKGIAKSDIDVLEGSIPAFSDEYNVPPHDVAIDILLGATPNGQVLRLESVSYWDGKTWRDVTTHAAPPKQQALIAINAVKLWRKNEAKLAAQAKEPKTLYANNCAGCHGQDGKAQTALARITKAPAIGRSAGMSEEKIGTAIRLHSKQESSNFRYPSNLAPGDVDSLVAYVRTLK